MNQHYQIHNHVGIGMETLGTPLQNLEINLQIKYFGKLTIQNEKGSVVMLFFSEKILFPEL